jgi:phospholipid/cholesterol/gamma-HCH transport system permease protein
MSYVGGAVLLSFGAIGWLLRPDKAHAHLLPGFVRTMTRQISWMLALGFPLVGLVHMAMGSFLALQAYYGSTFIDGTGAVVGVGLLRNLGGMMSGMILAALLATRMIPELRRLHRLHREDPEGPLPVAVRMAGPRIAAAAVACPLLSLWGVAVGTFVGWQAAVSMMGLPTRTFFMMMLKMMWFRDVVGLVVKGMLFGLLPAAICCHEALRAGFREAELAHRGAALHADAGTPLAGPVFRATCLGIVAILIVNMSWFMLVYHAVPFYGPTLLKTPSP